MPEETFRRDASVLVGNGLSIAFRSRLNLATITEEMIGRMQGASDNGDQVVHAMKEIARRALSEGEVADGDFEKLVGAFDSQALTLDELGKLADLVEEDPSATLISSIREVSAFSQRVRDMGISYVLEVVMERSRADLERDSGLHSLVEAISDQFDGTVTIGNLNYDTLLLAALLATKAPMTDMGLGYGKVGIRVTDPQDPDYEERYTGYALRTRANFLNDPAHRVRLLQLHGSLTYWHEVDGHKRHFKLPVEAVRSPRLWQELRSGEADWRPTVVLANQRDKARHVEKFPFNICYDSFQDSLASTDHWLVIGYSFRDACVNDVLRAEFLKRRDKPTVLVSTFGRELKRGEVEVAFGWGAEDNDSSPWLTINRGGAAGLEDTEDWAEFTGF